MGVEVESVKLLGAAPWLAEGIAAEELAAAERALVVPGASFAPGPWSWEGPRPAAGLLILSGRMARVLEVDEPPARGLELIGDGDLLRPWRFRGATLSIPSRVEWQALSELRVAELDLAFVRAARRWPRLWINLLDSAVERSRTLSYFLAARRASRVELRILLTLWHLADRWGQVNRDGVVLELPKLTHEMIAAIVAARRPSVTTGIRRLRELGVLEVRSRGRWVLLGDPVESLRRVRAGVPEPLAPGR